MSNLITLTPEELRAIEYRCWQEGHDGLADITRIRAKHRLTDDLIELRDTFDALVNPYGEVKA